MQFRFLSLVSTLTAVLAGYAGGAPTSTDPLASGFDAPPADARPLTFWHWMNGNVTRDGITRDLEAMARVGLGGVMMFDGSTYLPAGPAGYLGEHWRELVTHALSEGQRLGLEIGLHNAPGWSSSGGPWIEPAQSMQQLVWSEVTVSGGRRVDLTLPQPFTQLGFYRDALVVAFPALPGEAVPYAEAIERLAAGEEVLRPSAELSDGNLDTTVQLRSGEPLVMTLREPIILHGVMARSGLRGRFPTLRIEVSGDGSTFREIGSISGGGQHGIIAPAVRSFDPVEARVVRFTPRSAGEVAEIELYRAPRLNDWPAKANFDYRVAGPLTLPAPVAPNAQIDPARVVDLTSQVRDGRLVWDAPAGAWTVLRIGHTTTAKKNVAASAAGSGLESDKFSAEVTEFHFNHVIGRIQADAAAAGLEGPEALVIDSYEVGMQNWTAGFPEEFRQRTGYELTPYAPALFGRIVGDAGRTERFLYDFRRVQSDLMAEHYYAKMHELADAQGMRFYVEGYGPGTFDELRVSGSPDVPMTEFWTRTPWTPNRTVKMVTSAAHVYGKRVVAAEAFTGEAQTSRWLDYPYSLKALGDEMFAAGLNQLVFHRYAHQPHPTAVPGMTMGPWGFHFDRTNTWFEQSTGWLEYLQRAQFLLRQGTYAADVLYFTGERTPDSSQYRIPVVPPGYTYDLINADALLARVQVVDGQLVLPEGGRYRLLALPPHLRAMTPEVARRLHQLAQAGAMIVGPRPQFSPTLVGYPRSEQAMLRDVEAAWRLDAVRTGLSIAEALQQAGIAPDLSLAEAAPDASVAWQHRALPDGDLYFVANRQRRAEDVVVSLRDMAGRQPEIWRPETAERTTAPVFRTVESRLELPLRLEPAESVFIMLRRAPEQPPVPSVLRDDRVVVGWGQDEPSPPSPENNFTMALWVKPDTDLRVMPKESTSGRVDEVGKYYAIPADPGDLRFGPGHATAGLAVGRNGIFVIERSSDEAPAVLVWRQPVSGWTHVAVTYRDGVPELYVNGEHVRTGLRSGRSVHSGVGSPPPPFDYTLHFPGIESITRAAGEEPPPSRGQVYVFEGNFSPARVFPQPLSTPQIAELVAAGVPPPVAPVVTQLDRTPDGGARFLAWRSGTYSLGQHAATRRVEVPEPERIEGPWELTFQPDRGAPPSATLSSLESLHRHDVPGIRYFSGTVTYARNWQLDQPLRPEQRVVLDLGRVEVVADVTVNGKRAGVLWKEPYRIDVTDLVQEGENCLEIAVSTLWTNRLIGDERLPVEDEFGLHDERGEDPFGITRLPQWYLEGQPKPPGGRTTFATWRFYTADEPLVASGLLGPVRVWKPVRLTLPPPARSE